MKNLPVNKDARAEWDAEWLAELEHFLSAHPEIVPHVTRYFAILKRLLESGPEGIERAKAILNITIRHLEEIAGQGGGDRRGSINRSMPSWNLRIPDRRGH